jgi:hypothetical protein
MESAFNAFIGWDAEDEKASRYKRTDVEATYLDNNGKIRSKHLYQKRLKVAKRLGLYACILLLVVLKLRFSARVRAISKEECGIIWSKSSILVRNVTYINPNYTPIGSNRVTTYTDGCRGGVTRWSSILLASMNHKAIELKGIAAACVQSILAKDKCN